MARVTKTYAKDWITELRGEIGATNALTPPALDFGEVVAIKPSITIESHKDTTSYDEEDLSFQIDPSRIKVGDVVTLGVNPDGEAVVMGVLDGNDPDPTSHPEGKKLKAKIAVLQGQVKSWKPPVLNPEALPTLGNGTGDIRYSRSNNSLYAWHPSSTAWVLVSGGTSTVTRLDDLLDVILTGPVAGQLLGYDGTEWINVDPSAATTDPSKLPLAGGTLTGPLVMSAGTAITLPDAPVVGTDATNKTYVDQAITDAIAAALGNVVTPITVYPTVTVTSDYSALSSDQVILVDSRTGPVTITLPATHVDGQRYEIKDKYGVALTEPITVVSADGDTIDGFTDIVMTNAYEAITLVSNGSDWFVV